MNKYRKMLRNRPYNVLDIVLEESTNAKDLDRIDTKETLGDLASLQSSKNAQLAAKKISKKYQKIREVNKRKNKFKLPGEIVKIETVETSRRYQRSCFNRKTKIKCLHCKKGNKKYDELRKKKARKLARIKGERVIEKEPPKKIKSAAIVAKKITDKYKRLREKKNINIVEEIKDRASNKGVQINAKKISNKYKKMRYKKPPPTFLVDETDVETIDCNNHSDNNIFAKESVVIATNEILNKYKNDLDEAENKLCR